MKNNKLAVKSLSLGHFVSDMYSGFINPIMPFIAANLGMPLYIATFIMSFSHFCSSIMQPVYGYFADNIQKRFFIVWGLVFISIFIPLIGFAPNPVILCILLLLGSTGSGAFHPQATSLANSFSSGIYQTKSMSLFLAAGTAGYALGPLISSSIHDMFSDKALAYTSVLGLLTVVIMFVTVPKVKTLHLKVNTNSFFVSVKDIFANIPMRVLLLLSVSKSITTQAFSILTPFLWRSMNFSAFKIGSILFCYLIFSALGTVASPKLERYIGAKKVLVLSLSMILPLSFGFYLTYQNFQYLSFLFFFLIGFFAMLSVSINMLLAHKILPQYKSLTSGFIGGFCWGIAGILMCIVGVVAQNIGISYTLVLLSFLPLGFLFFLKYLPLK